MFNSRENLLYFMQTGEIHLSRNDYGFFSNLQNIIRQRGFVTTGQNSLFEKLLKKYSRQLEKAGHKINDLLSLEWKVEMRSTKEEYSFAYVSYDDGVLSFKVPFNKSFLSAFNNIPYSTFEWDKLHKKYVAPFSTTALKIIYNILPAHFKSVVYDDSLSKLLSEVRKFDAKIWSPTYYKSNGNFYIGAVNQSLYELVKNIDGDHPSTLYKLSQLGITIDESVINGDNLKKFASEFVTEIDVDDILTLSYWLKDIGVSDVVLGRGIEAIRGAQSEIKVYLNELNIKCHGPSSPTNYHAPVLIQTNRSYKSYWYGRNSIGKMVVLKNSRPIEIK